MSKSKEMVGAPKCRLELRDRQQRPKTAEGRNIERSPKGSCCLRSSLHKLISTDQ